MLVWHFFWRFPVGGVPFFWTTVGVFGCLGEHYIEIVGSL